MTKPQFKLLKCPCGKNFKHPTAANGRPPTYCPKCRKPKRTNR